MFFERAVRSQSRYLTLKEHFGRFYTAATHLTAPSSGVRNLELTDSLESSHFQASFLGVRIRFHFLAQYGDKNVLRGKVVVVRESPLFSEDADHIGSFSFDGRGYADFEVAEGEDQIYVVDAAVEIVLHFFHLALAKPLPESGSPPARA